MGAEMEAAMRQRESSLPFAHREFYGFANDGREEWGQFIAAPLLDDLPAN
jgi:hypothetical protein